MKEAKAITLLMADEDEDEDEDDRLMAMDVL